MISPSFSLTHDAGVMEWIQAMAHQANFPPVAGSRVLEAVRSEAFGAAGRVFLFSRLAVLCVAILAALQFDGPDPNGDEGERYAATNDTPALTQPFDGFPDAVLSPLARWDAVWYLEIARSGYGDEQRAAFFPLYPLLTRAVGALGGGSEGALLVASYLVSLAAFLGALVLLHKLVALELGRRLAGPALLLAAVFPASLYFGAPYSESLFLLASVGAFYAARTGHWAWAGVAGAAASGTRSAGVLLLLPLAVLWWQSRPRRRRDAAWLLLAPLGLVAYAVWLQLAHGDWSAFLDVQEIWLREFAGPFAGAWDGLVAAVDGARQLLSGSRTPVLFEEAGGDPFVVAGKNLVLFGFLAFAVVASVGVVRRLPRAYGVYVVAALALPLSFPVEPQPLMSLPRFLAVLFPLFMWLALVSEERRATPAVAAVCGMGLGLFVTQFATWQWVA